MDVRLALMTGVDIPIPDLTMTMHQPTIKEISMLGERNFFVGLQCLWFDKTSHFEDNIDLSNLSNFQIFMTIMLDKNAADKKADTMQVLQLLFPKYKFTFLPSRTILCNLGETNVIIDENNFTFLQEILKLVFCHKTSSADGFNPANEEARKIAQKLMRGRQRVAAQKQGDNEGSIFSQYISILAVGLGMPLTQLCELTVYQVYDLLERYRLNIAWDLDIRSRLAGGKPDSAPDDWMKNIH